MKKITDFIVDKRNIILILFIILTGICLYTSQYVSINSDITKYLPNTSETKIGKDIMDQEFEEQKSSTLNVMFKDLSEEEKQTNLEELKKIEGVSSVDYDDTDRYNNGEYTLYVIHVDDYDHSTTAENVYHAVKDHYDVAAMSGTIYDEYKPVLQLWIIVVAIAMAMVILTILSESYIEPWLYLISIGIAVFINKGTNIMFSSISNITNSITAILQLALSMDYSIMLSNRYRQEREHEKDKVKAMKGALYESFKAISSSSVTTVVGLLALVFMSFTIGKDLGFVLAKGVFLSLVSIFFCLPGLLLLCDKWIINSKKKSPTFHLNLLGKYSYKTRWIQLVFIIVAFVTSYLLKGNLGILYTGSQQDEVGKHFPATNQIAIVYENKYEDIISDYCKTIEDDEKANQVLCYGNTINEKLAYSELNAKFKELGQDTELDDYLIKIIYYNYYNKNNEDSMSLEEFIQFIKSDVYTNETLSNSIDEETKQNIDLLENFATVENINQKRDSKSLANILGISEKDAEKLFIYYNSKHLDTKMTIKDFVNFILNEVANDDEYSSSISEDTLSALNRLKPFIEENKINEQMTSDEIATIFQIDKNLVDQLFLFYRTTSTSDTKMTIHKFATLALQLKDNGNYKDMFSEDVVQKITLLQNLSDDALINKGYTQTELSNVLSSMGISSFDQNTVSLLYFYHYYLTETSHSKMTLNEFASFVLELKNNDLYQSYVSSIDEKNIKTLQTFTNSEKMNLALDASQMSNLLSSYGLKSSDIEHLYTYMYLINAKNPSTTKMTLNEFANFALSLDSSYLGSNETEVNTVKTKLQQLQLFSDDNKVNTLFTKEQMAGILNKNQTEVSAVYGVVQKDEMTIKEFVTACLSINNTDTELNTAKTIMDHSNDQMDFNTMSQMIQMNADKVSLLYQFYDGAKATSSKQLKVSVKDLFAFILNRYSAQDEAITSKLDAKQMSSVKEAYTFITLSNNTYTSEEISTLLNQLGQNVSSNDTKLLYSLKNYETVKDTDQLSVKEMINFIVNHKDNPVISSNLGENQDLLLQAYHIVNHTSDKFSYAELSKLIGEDDRTIQSIYGVYDYYEYHTTLSPIEFVNLILNNQSNSLLSSKLSSDMIHSLNLVKTVMTSTINHTSYNAHELSNILGSDEETLKLVMSLYNTRYIKENETISLLDFTDFMIQDVIPNPTYASSFDEASKTKLNVVNGLMKGTANHTSYRSFELYQLLGKLSDELDDNLVDLVYIYHGSQNDYDESWKLTVEELIHYLNDDLLNDEKFSDFIDEEMKQTIRDAKESIDEAKNLLVTDQYSRAIINSKYGFEDEDTFEFVQKTIDTVGKNDGVYVIGDSPMALEISQTFDGEMNYITILTMIFIFVVVAFTFKDLLISLILVLIIQCAVFVTMAILSMTGTNVYFISLLIVQAILMGATIDYAIVYTSYYKESRITMGVQDSIINAYNKSIHTILSSSSILIIVTLIVSSFAEAIAAKICETISQGTFCSVILILFVLPGVLAAFDKIICRKNVYKENKKVKTIK